VPFFSFSQLPFLSASNRPIPFDLGQLRKRNLAFSPAHAIFPCVSTPIFFLSERTGLVSSSGAPWKCVPSLDFALSPLALCSQSLFSPPFTSLIALAVRSFFSPPPPQCLLRGFSGFQFRFRKKSAHTPPPSFFSPASPHPCVPYRGIFLSIHLPLILLRVVADDWFSSTLLTRFQNLPMGFRLVPIIRVASFFFF